MANEIQVTGKSGLTVFYTAAAPDGTSRTIRTVVSEIVATGQYVANDSSIQAGDSIVLEVDGIIGSGGGIYQPESTTINPNDCKADVSGLAPASEYATEMATVTAIHALIKAAGAGDVAAIKIAAERLTATKAGYIDQAISTDVDLKSTGLDNIPITEPTGVATTFREMFVQVWRRFFKKHTKDDATSTIKTYKDDDSVNTTQAISDDGTIETVGAAS